MTPKYSVKMFPRVVPFYECVLTTMFIFSFATLTVDIRGTTAQANEFPQNLSVSDFAKPNRLDLDLGVGGNIASDPPPLEKDVSKPSYQTFTTPDFVFQTPAAWSENETSASRSVRDTIIVEMDVYVKNCPATVNLLKESCLKNSFTCKSRCGATTNNDMELDSIPCRCDSLCAVYKDCCPDFREECPTELEEAERTSAPLLDEDAECLSEGYRVVSSCNQDLNLIPFDDTVISSNLLVTDNVTGITYKNYSVFQCHAQKDSQPEFWTKTLKTKDSLDGSLLQSFWGEGHLSQFLVIDYPPPEVYPRICHSKTTINCFGITEDDCRFISPSSGLDFCAEIYELSKNSTFVNLTSQETFSRTCQIRLKNQSKRTLHSFSVTMSLNEDDEMVVTGTSAGNERIPWERIACRAEEGGKVVCDKMDCSRGFFYTGSNCLPPSLLKVTFIFRGLSSDILSKILSIVTSSITSLRTHFICESTGGFVDMEEGEPVYTESCRVVNNSLIDGGDEIPPTSALKQILLDIPKEELHEFPEYLQVCFVFKLTVYGVVTDNQFQNLNEDVALRCDIIKITLGRIQTISVTTKNPSFLAGLSENDNNRQSSICTGLDCNVIGVEGSSIQHQGNLLFLMLLLAGNVAMASGTKI